MKTFLIGASIIACLYSSQTFTSPKQHSEISPAGTLDDTLVYGPQLPCYYSRSISEYVRRIFQDSKGNLWFGTNTDGLAMYNGQNLTYISTSNGLKGSQVTGIMEDKQGNLWFSTNNGITKYNPSAKAGSEESYRHFGENEGLSHASAWSIFQDREGTIWAGTFSGLCRFNGNQFEPILVTGAEKSWVRCIASDHEGNLWIGTADKGAFRFDGKTFQQFTKKNGLCSNDLTSTLEDKQGNLWFGSMDGGISKYDGKTFTNITSEAEIGNNEVWTICEDNNGAIWFSSEGFGVYCYKAGKLTNFSEKQGFHMKAVQAIYQDRTGRIWLGGGNGLYQFSGGLFTPVTKDGPWEEGC